MSTLKNEEDHLLQMTRPQNLDKDPFLDLSWEDVFIPKILCYLTLKELFVLRSCSHTSKRLVEAAFERLKKVNLSCNPSHNADLVFIMLGKYCVCLEHLYLSCCDWLTDEILLPILVKNKRLKSINLNECVKLTPLSLQTIILECKHLHTLHLSDCQWLTSGALDAMTLHRSNLKNFDISHCGALGERSLITAFRKLNNLTILSLANTQGVTDKVLIEIGRYCQALEHINLVGCSAITDFGIDILSSQCLRLKSLLVRRCYRITERSLGPLRKRVFIDKTNQFDLFQNDFYPSDFLIY